MNQFWVQVRVSGLVLMVRVWGWVTDYISERSHKYRITRVCVSVCLIKDERKW